MSRCRDRLRQQGERAARLGQLTPVGALAWLVACSSAPPPPTERPPPVVQTVVVSPAPLPATVSAVGTIRSPEMTTVASEIPGIVREIDVPQGQPVPAGHVLVRLDDGTARATLDAALARQRATRDRLDRARSLRASGVASPEALDDAQAAFDAASAEVDGARSRLDKTVIRAPFPGLVGLRPASLYPGQVLDAGDGIVQMTRVDALEVAFAVPQEEAARIAVGQDVLGVVGACGTRFTGRVEALDPRVTPTSRMLDVHALVPTNGHELLPGMAVRLRVLVGERADALRVPQEAVVRQGTRHIVWTIGDDGKAEEHEVSLGELFVDGIEVRSGLAPGAVVVAAGQQRLKAGIAVRAEPWKPIANPLLELGWRGPTTDCIS